MYVRFRRGENLEISYLFLFIVTKIVTNAQTYADIRGWGRDDFDPVTQYEVLQTGLFGHIWTVREDEQNIAA